ncbi:MAG: hypothetical protein HOO93_18610 [Methyloglobulus sp.]|nr:hypothetical protein [Methyloglobulus sp.]
MQRDFLPLPMSGIILFHEVFCRLMIIVVGLLLSVQLFAAQLNSGDIVVVDYSVGLLRLEPVTGTRTVLSNFSDASQGELGLGPFNLAVETSNSILAVDPQVNKLFRVNPATGQRTVLSDFSDSGQGPIPDNAAQDGVLGIAVEPSGQIIVTAKGAGSPDSGGTVFRDALLRVNPVTGQRTLLSDFGDPDQGVLGGQCSFGVAIEATGKILVTDCNNLAGSSGGLLFRIDPATGQRTVLSDFGNSSQGTDIAQLPSGITVEASGQILVVVPFFKGTIPGGALFRVDPVSGQRTLLSDFGNIAQGASGTLLRGVTTESNGNILVVDQDVDDFIGSAAGAIFRVNPSTGQRTVLSDFGDPALGLGQAPSGVAVIPKTIENSFAAFDNRMILYRSYNGYLIGEGTFTLGNLSNGIDPYKEAVTLSFSDKDGKIYSQTLPTNAFKAIGKSFYIFHATKESQGISLMEINPTKNTKQFTFRVVVNKIDLRGADMPPVEISLQIGDDIGSETIPCRVLSKLLVCS